MVKIERQASDKSEVRKMSALVDVVVHLVRRILPQNRMLLHESHRFVGGPTVTNQIDHSAVHRVSDLWGEARLAGVGVADSTHSVSVVGVCIVEVGKVRIGWV